MLNTYLPLKNHLRDTPYCCLEDPGPQLPTSLDISTTLHSWMSTLFALGSVDMAFVGPSLQSSQYVLPLLLRALSGAYKPSWNKECGQEAHRACLPHFRTKKIIALGAWGKPGEGMP